MRLKIGISFFIVFLLFGLTKGSSKRTHLYIVEKMGAKVEHMSVPEKIGEGSVFISTKITSLTPLSDNAVKLFYRTKKKDELRWIPMEGRDGGIFVGEIPEHGKGVKLTYFIQLTMPSGEVISVPQASLPGSKTILLRFKGKVNKILILSHILFMFASIFVLLFSFFYSFDIIFGKRDTKDSLFPIELAFLFIFIGGFPLGWLMGWQRYGKAWSGFPFGGDITDNKTLFVFLYWLVVLILVNGSLIHKDSSKDILKPKIFAWVTIIGVLFTIGVYLIPHSI